MAERPPDALLPEFTADDEDQVGAGAAVRVPHMPCCWWVALLLAGGGRQGRGCCPLRLRGLDGKRTLQVAALPGPLAAGAPTHEELRQDAL